MQQQTPIGEAIALGVARRAREQIWRISGGRWRLERTGLGRLVAEGKGGQDVGDNADDDLSGQRHSDEPKRTIWMELSGCGNPNTMETICQYVHSRSDPHR